MAASSSCSAARRWSSPAARGRRSTRWRSSSVGPRTSWSANGGAGTGCAPEVRGSRHSACHLRCNSLLSTFQSNAPMRVLGAFLFNTLCNFGIGLIVAKFLGPAEYGRFALTLAIALTIQIALLDWTRLCAVRFYSERVRAAEPTIRATLDMAFALISFGIAGIAVVVAFLDGGLDPTRGLIGLALGVSIANSLFDYKTALVRARFHDRLYGRLVIIKNIFSLVLTGGAAFLFESAAMALLGGILSLTGSILTAWAALGDEGAGTSQA